MVKGTKIKLEFTIPDDSPQREIIARKFTELMDALNEDQGQGELVNKKTTDKKQEG